MCRDPSHSARSRSTWPRSGVPGARSAASTMRTVTPWRGRRSCSRSLRLRRSVSGHCAGSSTDCRPSARVRKPAKASSASTPKKTARRPCARAAAAKRRAAIAVTPAAASGRPTAIHDRPVSRYGCAASVPSGGASSATRRSTTRGPGSRPHRCRSVSARPAARRRDRETDAAPCRRPRPQCTSNCMGTHVSRGADVQAVLDGVRRIVQALRASSRWAERHVGLSGAQLFVLQKAGRNAGHLGERACRTHAHPPEQRLCGGQPARGRSDWSPARVRRPTAAASSCRWRPGPAASSAARPISHRSG